MNLTHIFGPDGNVSWWQECTRGLVVFIYGVLVIRLAGRRVFGRWAALDTVLAIMVGSNLSRVFTGTAAVGGTLAGTTLIIALHWLLAHAAARSDRLSRILEGMPEELARDGKINRRNALRRSVSRNAMEEALRESKLEHLDDARLVMLEPSGRITVLKAE